MTLLELHEGEAMFNLGWPEVVVALALLLAWIQAVRLGKALEPRTVREFVAVLNTKGGNIIILGSLSLYFFSKSMQLFYHALGLMTDKQLTPENAVLLMAIQFTTSSAFGGSMGSLLTMLTGDTRHQQQRTGDNPPNGTPPKT